MLFFQYYTLPVKMLYFSEPSPEVEVKPIGYHQYLEQQNCVITPADITC
jgi:hypothetical protein